MKKTKVILFKYIQVLIFSLFLLSCEKDEQVVDSLSPVEEADLPEEISLGQAINVFVKHTGYNGCARYSRTETIVKGKEIEVTFYAKGEEGKTICSDALITIETPFKYTPKTTGIYIFNFNQRDKYLTKTVIVK